MKLLRVNALEGAAWVRRGFQVFLRHPLPFMAMFLAMMLFASVLQWVPLVGLPLLLVLSPLASLGFMIATRVSVDGQTPTPRAFVEPLRGQRAALLRLGLIFLVAAMSITWVVDVVDGGAFARLAQVLFGRSGGGDVEDLRKALGDPALELGTVLFATLSTALSIAFWHAPALVHWAGQGVAQALFSSWVACWRNKGAFAVFGLVWGAVMLACAITINVVVALLGVPQLAVLATVPVAMLLVTVFYVSIWFSFAGCFGPDDAPPPQETP